MRGGTGQVSLRVVWCLDLVVLILQLFVFLGGIRDVHLYRRDMRAKRLAAKSAESGKGVCADDCEDIEMGALLSAQSPSTQSPSTRLPHPARPEPAPAELASKILVELPDGQILELPEGSRVELPGEATRAELPSQRSMGKLETRNLHVAVSAVELESPSSGAQSLQRSPATAWSF